MARTGKEIETLWIKATTPILHDGQRILIGAVVEIEKLAAEALVKLGAAEAVPAPAAGEPQKSKA